MRARMMIVTAALLAGIAVPAAQRASAAALGGSPTALTLAIDLQQQSLVTEVQGPRRGRGAGRGARRGHFGRGHRGGRRHRGGINPGAAAVIGIGAAVLGIMAVDAARQAEAGTIRNCARRYGAAYDPETRWVYNRYDEPMFQC